jgi:tRNA(fMet)-specific endonuclease VapC
MSGRFLLDTNIVIRLLNGDVAVGNRMDNADEPFLSVVVLGELFYGAYKSQAVRKNILRIQELAERVTVLVCDEHTANEFGMIKNALRAKGRPVPENDAWIAAQAQQHGLILVTRDDHFKEVDGLHVERW